MSSRHASASAMGRFIRVSRPKHAGLVKSSRLHLPSSAPNRQASMREDTWLPPRCPHLTPVSSWSCRCIPPPRALPPHACASRSRRSWLPTAHPSHCFRAGHSESSLGRCDTEDPYHPVAVLPPLPSRGLRIPRAPAAPPPLLTRVTHITSHCSNSIDSLFPLPPCTSSTWSGASGRRTTRSSRAPVTAGTNLRAHSPSRHASIPHTTWHHQIPQNTNCCVHGTTCCILIPERTRARPCGGAAAP